MSIAKSDIQEVSSCLSEFKELNEKYGAKTGDEVLNILTDAIRRYIDTQLRIFRMPGDECAIFMPYTIEDNIEQAKNLYKRIRNRIDRVIEHRKYSLLYLRELLNLIRKETALMTY